MYDRSIFSYIYINIGPHTQTMFNYFGPNLMGHMSGPYSLVGSECKRFGDRVRDSESDGFGERRGQNSKTLKEVRVLFCQTSPASASAREFVQKNYKELKTLNPKLPILIRECSGTQPQLWARYAMGVQKGIRLDGLTEPQISKVLGELVKAGGAAKA